VFVRGHMDIFSKHTLKPIVKVISSMVNKSSSISIYWAISSFPKHLTIVGLSAMSEACYKRRNLIINPFYATHYQHRDMVTNTRDIPVHKISSISIIYVFKFLIALIKYINIFNGLCKIQH